MPAPITVLMPTLNAAADMPRGLASLGEGLTEGLIRELIVSDGGSTDATLDIADAAGATIVTGPASRGGQLRRGAVRARADWLMVLHADTVLGQGWTRPVAEAIRHGQAGYFTLRFDATGLAPRVVAALVVSLLLTVIVAMTAMVTAFVLNVGNGSISAGAYLDSFVSFSQPTDLFLAEFKALIFGFVATIVAAHKGLSASGGPKGVADAVNQAVVLSVILLAVINVAITQAYVMLVPQGIA